MLHARSLDAESLHPELVAACGIDCGVCIRAFRAKDPCPGCRSDGHKPRYCEDCAIRSCSSLPTTAIPFCFGCGTFPCASLRRLDVRYRTRYRTSPLANLETIESRGLEHFVEEERVRWTCSACGALTSVHKDYCMGCGTPR